MSCNDKKDGLSLTSPLRVQICLLIVDMRAFCHCGFLGITEWGALWALPDGAMACIHFNE